MSETITEVTKEVTTPQTPEEVRVELEHTDKEQLIEYIFNQAGIIGRMNEMIIEKDEALRLANESKEMYAQTALDNLEIVSTIRSLVAEPPLGDPLFRTGEEWLDATLTNAGLKEGEETNE